MENKENYFQKLVENQGQLNEIDLGEIIGLNEEETREIIAQLLWEHKIEFITDRACNYRITKTIIRKKNR